MAGVFSRRDILRRLMTASWWGMARRSRLMQSSAFVAAQQEGWFALPIGGGGYVTGINITPTGEMAVRTDTYNGYLRESPADQWRLAFTAASLPAGNRAPGFNSFGVYELVRAPSNPDIIFMCLSSWNASGDVYKSTDAGATWVATSWTATNFEVGGFRFYGPHIAIDPSDPDHVIIGSDTVVRRTTNGGTSWAAVTGVPNATTTRGHLIAFDPSDNQIIYILSNGNGVYRSTDGGDNFSAETGDPTTGRRIAIGADGVVMVAGDADSSDLRCRQSGSWSNLSVTANSGEKWHGLAPDPDNAGHWYINRENARPIRYSANNGTTWTNEQFGTRVEGDVPWHGNAMEDHMSNGSLSMYGGNLYAAYGIGVSKVVNPRLVRCRSIGCLTRAASNSS
jgi:hypothetical protein